MKLLLSGGSGQLGRAIVAQVARRGAPDIIAPPRDAMDLERPDDLVGLVARVAPDVVVNCAAYTAVDRAETDPDGAARVNVAGAAALARAAARCGAQFVGISTDYVFNGPSGQALTEGAPVAPVNVYGHTKRAGELAILAELPSATVLRTAWLHSAPGPSFVSRILDAPRGVAEVVDDQWGSPTNAVQFAKALLGMLQRRRATPSLGLGSIYHLANAGGTSWARFAEHALACARGHGGAKVVRRIASERRLGAPRPRWSVLDSAKFSHDFGLALPHWTAGVGRTVDALLRDREGWTAIPVSG